MNERRKSVILLMVPTLTLVSILFFTWAKTA